VAVAGRGAYAIRLLGRLTLQTEQKYPVLLEYAKASFERIKQRLRHLRALARVKRLLLTITRWAAIWTVNSAICRLACARYF